jgi:hypothetical protein
MTKSNPIEQRPWYREPMVWLMIAIPGLTVPAGLITLMLALRHPAVEIGPTVIEQVRASAPHGP